MYERQRKKERERVCVCARVWERTIAFEKPHAVLDGASLCVVCVRLFSMEENGRVAQESSKLRTQNFSGNEKYSISTRVCMEE